MLVPPLLGAEVIWALRVFLGDVDEGVRPEALVAAQNLSASALEVSVALATPLKKQARAKTRTAAAA